jgi:hypothetical protein
MPERIQLSRAAGWRMPPNTVKVDRSTRWGNPFQASVFGAERAVQLYENTVTGFWSPDIFRADEPDALVAMAYAAHCELQCRPPVQQHFQISRVLRGKNLACWCKPGTPCHADVLLRLANQPEGAACAR